MLLSGMVMLKAVGKQGCIFCLKERSWQISWLLKEHKIWSLAFKSVFLAKSCEQSCFLQTAGSSLWKSTGKNLHSEIWFSVQASQQKIPSKPTGTSKSLGWFVFPFVPRDIWSASILHSKAETLLDCTDAPEFQHNQ